MILARVLITGLAFVIVASPLRADTLRVMTYNSLNFEDEDDADRLDDFRIVMNYVNPDVVAMQEIRSEEAVDLLLSFAFLPTDDDWAAAQFQNGPDTDNILFYRTSKVELMSQRAIPTDPRDVNEYVLRPVAPDTSQRIRVFSAHLKAGDSASDALRRAGSCTAMRQQFDLLEPGALFLFVGDFNLYTASEDAYEILLSEAPNPVGQLFDPIDAPGEWHNSISFADIHTQSPRLNGFDGGTGGGMDDRFDFLLVSGGLIDTSGTYVLPETYYAVGNDGEHFNESINDGTNFAVPDSVADALYFAADHLPVVVDLLLRMQGTPVAEQPVPRRLELLTCYPNPFNSSLTIQIADPRAPATLAVYDLLGRRIHEQSISGGAARLVRLDFSSAATGTYLVQLQSKSATEIQRVLQVR